MHFFLLAYSFAANLLTLILRSTPSVSTLSANVTPSSLLNWTVRGLSSQFFLTISSSPSLPFPRLLFIFPFKSAVMSSTKNPQLQRRVMCCNFTQRILQHNTWKQVTPLRPWQDGRDGPERLRHTSFELHSPLVLEITAKHPQDLPWETEVCRPGPDHRKLTRSKAFARSRTKATAP